MTEPKLENKSPMNEKGSRKIGQTAKAFAALFRGRTDAWGSLPSKCIYEPVTFVHYERHLRGKVSLGVYPLLDDGTCFWAAADLDQDGSAPWHDGPDDGTPALTLIESLGYYGVNIGICLEKTKSKGWRIWTLFSAPVPARDVRRLFRAALAKAGLPSSVELFPRQDHLGKPTRENPHPVGNYVHLPYFGGGPSGPRGGRVCVDLKTLRPIPLQDFLRQLRTFPTDAFPLVLENLPPVRPKQSVGRGGDEIIDVLSRTLMVGERRPTLVKLAGYFRYRGIPEEVAVALLLPWAEKAFNDPLPPKEVERHIRGIYRRYGLRDHVVTQQKTAKHNKRFFVEVEV